MTGPVVSLLPARNAAGDLPAHLESVARFADAVVALDDGSTDDTRRLLQEHPLVQVVLTNPVRRGYQGWDDSLNRNRLLDAALELSPSWVVSLDADELIPADDAAAMRSFLLGEADPEVAYLLPTFRMIGDLQHYDGARLWVGRVFSPKHGHRFPADRLHFVPIPTAIPDDRWVRTTFRIQHCVALTPELRRARFVKYQEADPGRRWQRSYDHLLSEPRRPRRWHPRGPFLPAVAHDPVPDPERPGGLEPATPPAIEPVAEPLAEPVAEPVANSAIEAVPDPADPVPDPADPVPDPAITEEPVFSVIIISRGDTMAELERAVRAVVDQDLRVEGLHPDPRSDLRADGKLDLRPESGSQGQPRADDRVGAHGRHEVIVVISPADGHTPVAPLAQSLRAAHPEVEVVELDEPALPGVARNAGLALATGRYVAFPGSHVELNPGNLAARLATHRSGWPMVTDTMLNATRTRSGWASYFLDNAPVLPDRPSYAFESPPLRCSYRRSLLDEVGGFPEDRRTGEDSVVNEELFHRGYGAYRRADATSLHHSPCTTVGHLARHHFQRGRGRGHMSVEARDRGEVTTRQMFSSAARWLPGRLRYTHREVRLWGGGLKRQYYASLPLVVIGASSAWIGCWFELARRMRSST